MKEQIITKKCGECHGPYALGIKYGNMVFTTQIGTDITGELVAGGITEQTKQLMENAKAVLEAAGSSMDQIAKVTIYVLDMAVVPEMNEVYKTYFSDNYPARCCTQCAGMVDGCLVEMEFTAFAD
ncbi:RidA family protein [Anaeromicropila populeti]|uniref:2-iminobutanoate/2-iminopropanoate deaminase n=1 Tax=Anaeromicropila populeti TaxID=37658 RepID=A0A1I6HMN1_9FIRM|nr:Rid family hydrolase [Anaeromicropila populeti]SFR55540.1 2-iminobutanoate/2-iminopropanoate deaminase [Anaeromicropila populeti]